MDIRKKTIVIVSITLLCLILALYASSELIVQGGFSRVETQSAQKDTDRVLVALANDINALDAVAYDWASREDTRQYVAANGSGTEWTTLDPDLVVSPINPDTCREVPFPADITYPPAENRKS